jgi:glutamate transport system substrate-binding protein
VNTALKQYVSDGSWEKALQLTVAPSGYSMPDAPTPGSA